MKTPIRVAPPAILVLAATLPSGAAEPTPAWTQSGSVGLATDYVFRGVSQMTTSSSAAFSGNVDLSHSSGFAIGIAAANQTLNSDDGRDSLELDLYASQTIKAGTVELSAGLISYNYPGATPFNTLEANLGLAWSGLSARCSRSLTRYFAADGSSGTSYLEVAYSRSISDLTLTVHQGWTRGEGAMSSYRDTRLAASYPLAGCVATLAWTNADLGALAVAPTGRILDKATVTFSLARSF